MFLLLLLIGVIGMVVGLILDSKLRYFDAFPITFTSVLILIIAVIGSIILGVQVSNLAVIDDKIEMFQEENTKIEEQIATVVSEYQVYEKEIFTTVKPESAMTLVALYPDLKTDTLVQKQIEVYVTNNDKIKSLKEEKFTGNVCRWWLYFGSVKGE